MTFGMTPSGHCDAFAILTVGIIDGLGSGNLGFLPKLKPGESAEGIVWQEKRAPSKKIYAIFFIVLFL
jgi:hypothetical protein